MKTDQNHINQLLIRCQKNDTKAQLAIYQLYNKAMYNSAYRILNDVMEAEDIMQEAFLAGFTKLSTFKGEVTFGSWLKKIVINKSLTQLQKNKKIEKVSLDVVPEVSEETPISYQEIDVKFALKMIQKLKKNYRIVLTLHLIEGFDYQEIASILKISNENVRTTVSRAKKKLQQLLIHQKTQN